MFKYIIAILACIFLFGCELPKEIKRVEKIYEIIEIKSPKRFKVTLKDTENGIIYERLYVSKWCSSWRNLKIGSKWKFDEVTYQKGKEVYTKVDKVSELCSQLKSL